MRAHRVLGIVLDARAIGAGRRASFFKDLIVS